MKILENIHKIGAESNHELSGKLEKQTKRKAFLDEFDKIWQVHKGVPTYLSFLSELDGNLKAILDRKQRIALGILAKKVREIDSQRWADYDTQTGEPQRKEKYHAHGLYSGWVAGKIIIENIKHFDQSFTKMI